MSECVRPGCAGSYRPDGTCDECGYKAPATGRTPTGESTSAESTTDRADSGSRADRPSRRGTYPIQRITIGGSAPRWLGDGLVDVPAVPPRDPTMALLPPDTEVPEHRKRCRNCDRPVGRAAEGRPARDDGFCSHCGTRYSFSPKLFAGDLVEGRYEVLGCLAFGGLGWLHLARDRNLGDDEAQRWVVLKGLIDTEDPDALAAALDEKRFLVEVDHPNIVTIHDFVRHPDPRTSAPVGYIVMEYLGGRSLQQIFTDHRDEHGNRAPLPLPVVLAYGLRILDALEYLHGKGLVYCDLKPENVLQVGDQLKLIDLGAVVRLARPPRAIYGTPGFQAPELAHSSPSPASDLYTVGRTLAVLSFPFGGFTQEYRNALPERLSVPLLAEEESFDRLLRRATDLDPERRFGSATRMRQQVHGVLREVVADGRPSSFTLFGPERQTVGASGEPADNGDPAGIDWATVAQALPVPLVDQTDPAAGFLGTLGAVDPTDLADTLLELPRHSPEVLLRLVDVCLATGALDAATHHLAEAEKSDAARWRLDWYAGLVAFATGRTDDAIRAFDAVYDDLPGEPAPKLALAAALERDGRHPEALELYDRVWRTDREYLSAAFGLARLLHRVGRHEDAVDVLDGVPSRFTQHTSAQIAAIRLRLAQGPSGRVGVLDASARLQRLRMDLERTALMSVEVLTAALDLVLSGEPGDSGDPADSADTAEPVTVLGYEFAERHLRAGLETAYRDLAKLADDPDRRSALVDKANRLRPKTWL